MNKKRTKKISIIILVLALILVPFSAYEYSTLPHSISAMPQENAYKLINNSIDSSNATAALSYLGSSETVMVGLDLQKNISSGAYYGPVLYVVKTSQKIGAPLTGLTYEISSVNMKYGSYNCTLSQFGTNYNNTYIESLYSCTFDILGNYTLTFYIHLTPVGEIGFLHFAGNSVVAKLSINVTVSNIPP